jgi:hypothetical protein
MPNPVKINTEKVKQVIGLKKKTQNQIEEPKEGLNSFLENEIQNEKIAKENSKNFSNPISKFFEKKEVKNDSKSLIVTNLIQNNELSVDIKETKLTPKNKRFEFIKNPAYSIAILFSLVSGLLFVYTAFAERAVALGAPKVPYENLVLGIFCALLVLDLLFVFFIKTSRIKRFHIFFALITLQISCFFYALKIFGTSLFTIYNFSVNTQIIIFLMPVLILLQAIGIIQEKNRIWVNIAQAFIILNQLFSTVKIFNEQSFAKKQFSSDVFNTIFDFPPFVWVLFATLALATLSTYSLKQGYTRFIFVVGMMFPILNILLYTRVSTYWYQTIMALIVWDMFYMPMFESEKETSDKHVMSRLMVSSIYHIALFTLLLIFNTVLNFVIVRP